MENNRPTCHRYYSGNRWVVRGFCAENARHPLQQNAVLVFNDRLHWDIISRDCDVDSKRLSADDFQL